MLAVDDPPPFVRLASHPVRWRLMRELFRSDRAVAELTSLVDAPQSLVSYHLRLLREGGLVSARRSSADGRDSYYTLDVGACRTALDGVDRALGVTTVRRRVLFLCTGNSARSQIAEALLAHMSSGAIEARSAGSKPKPLHPNAVRVLRRRGIDISGNRSKHVDEFTTETFDVVITLCDRVREECPEFPGHPELVHWSIPDPAVAGATDRATYPAFEHTTDELATRIGVLLDRPRRSHDAER